jgi:hypothetical protein
VKTPFYSSPNGCAARYTKREAWVLVDGTWRKGDPVFFRLAGSAPLTKREYRKRFGDVPPLPSIAFDPDHPSAAYGCLDGAPTRFTHHEAWACFTNTWRKISVTEAITKAALLPELEYLRIFRHRGLPPLPDAAFRYGWLSPLVCLRFPSRAGAVRFLSPLTAIGNEAGSWESTARPFLFKPSAPTPAAWRCSPRSAGPHRASSFTQARSVIADQARRRLRLIRDRGPTSAGAAPSVAAPQFLALRLNRCLVPPSVSERLTPLGDPRPEFRVPCMGRAVAACLEAKSEQQRYFQRSFPFNCPLFAARNARISLDLSSSFSHCSLYKVTGERRSP